MKNNVDELLIRLTDFLRSEARTETVVGKEFKLGEYSCVPVIRVGLGFGYGGGEGDAPAQGHGLGSGAGAGVGLAPLGFLVTRGADITFIHANASKGLTAAFERMPELLEKFLENRQTVPAVPVNN